MLRRLPTIHRPWKAAKLRIAAPELRRHRSCRMSLSVSVTLISHSSSMQHLSPEVHLLLVPEQGSLPDSAEHPRRLARSSAGR